MDPSADSGGGRAGPGPASSEWPRSSHHGHGRPVVVLDSAPPPCSHLLSTAQEGGRVDNTETIWKAKLLMKGELLQLSALLSDIGLNIREAHVLSTTDGYSLNDCVIDGWPVEVLFDDLSASFHVSLSQ